MDFIKQFLTLMLVKAAFNIHFILLSAIVGIAVSLYTHSWLPFFLGFYFPIVILFIWAANSIGLIYVVLPFVIGIAITLYTHSWIYLFLGGLVSILVLPIFIWVGHLWAKINNKKFR